MRSLLVVSMIAAAGSIASAGPYIGIGIGTGPSLSNNTIASPEQTSRSGRLLLGYSFHVPVGRLSIEGEANTFDLDLNGVPMSSTMGGFGLKYSFPLGSGFEVFGRGGLQRTWLSNGVYAGDGDGYYLGAGFELRIPIFGSVFVDYERQAATIDSSTSTTYDESAGMFTLGATVNL
ncbi:MAG TPA: outer membrane beta-barrel protein [Kofleriaceae bacterium]|jgi:hypothetical protein